MIGRLAAILFAVLVFGRPPAPAQTSGRVTGDAVLARVAALLDGVHDYTVTLHIVSDIDRLNVPPMEVTMYFKQPNKVHFAAEGFAMLPREGLRLNPRELVKLYAVERLEADTLEGSPKHRLVLIPRSESPAARSLQLVVDPHRFTPDRVISSTADGRTVVAAFEYLSVGGTLMPARLTVTFASEAPPPPEPSLQDPATLSIRPVPRTGTVTVHYFNYRMNTGLSDDVFSGRD